MLVEELRAAGWVDASAGTYRLIPARNYRERHDISADQTVEAVDSLLKSSGAIVLSLPVGPARDAPQELVFWERPKGTPLDVSVCQGIDLVLSTTLRVVPSLESGTELYCGACGAELLAQLEATDRDVWDQSPPQLEGVFDTCPSCAKVLEFGALSAARRSPDDGSLEPEDAPLFRCALVLTSDAPPDPRAVTDDRLLTLLNAVTGIAFRALGRYR